MIAPRCDEYVMRTFKTVASQSFAVMKEVTPITACQEKTVFQMSVRVKGQFRFQLSRFQ